MDIRKKAKNLIKKTERYLSNRSYRKYFLQEKNPHTTFKLSQEQKQSITHFYKPYFNVNPLFHAFYTEKTGRFDAEYIPDDMWFTVIDRYFNNREKAKVLDHKSYYERMFAGSSVKHPETILHRINGFWYDSKMRMINQAEAAAIIGVESSLFVKMSADSCGGRGVRHISNAEDIVTEFHKAIAHGNDVVVQRAIKQHPDLYKLGKSSVNTIRIVSLLSEKTTKIYSSILRMGIGDSRVDNASSGGITVGIMKGGLLKEVAYTMFGVKYDCHPTTKVRFSDVVVPSYDRICDLVEKLHPLIPDFRLVSWDFAVDEEGCPILLEVNLCMGQLDFHQLNNGPIFKEDTPRILNEVFKKI